MPAVYIDFAAAEVVIGATVLLSLMTFLLTVTATGMVYRIAP